MKVNAAKAKMLAGGTAFGFELGFGSTLVAEALSRTGIDYLGNLTRINDADTSNNHRVTLGWDRWVGDEGAIIGLDHFGASAPAGTIFEHFGFTPDRVAEVGRRVVREGLHGRIPTVDGGHFGHMASDHPTVSPGESGVGRTPTSDPGHS